MEINDVMTSADDSNKWRSMLVMSDVDMAPDDVLPITLSLTVTQY